MSKPAFLDGSKCAHVIIDAKEIKPGMSFEEANKHIHDAPWPEDDRNALKNVTVGVLSLDTTIWLLGGTRPHFQLATRVKSA